MTARPQATASPLAVWAGILTLYVVWGTTYLGMAIAIESVPPFVMMAIRFFIAGGALLAFTAARHRGLPATSRRQLRDSLIVGTGLAAIGNAFVAWGEQTVPSGIAAVLIALMPAWLAGLGRLLFRDRLSRPVVAGIGLGLLGVVLLAGPWTGASGGTLEPGGLVALLLAPVGWALASLYAARRASLPGDPLYATALQMLGGAFVLVLMATATGEVAGFVPSRVTVESVAAIGYLAVAGSLIGYTTYGWLLQVAPISRVATYTYVNPVVAVFLGWLVVDEPVTPRTLAASAVILVAVALIVTARARGTRRAPASVPVESRNHSGPVADAGAVPLSTGPSSGGPAVPAASEARAEP
jgi:drug/metabolite transporter (DMT)-like permease